MTPLPLRLPPGSDLRLALESALRSEGLSGGFVVSGIGSLSEVRIRFAAATDDSRLAGPFELLSLAGSVSPDGAHLHMVVADANGAVSGGHVSYGNVVRTTAEILLQPLPGWRLSRAWDPETGFKELVIDSDGQPGQGPGERLPGF